MNIANTPPADLAGLRVRLDAYQRTADALRSAGRPLTHHLAELIDDLQAEILAREQAWEDQHKDEAANQDQVNAVQGNGRRDELRWLLVALSGVLLATAAFLYLR